MLNEGDVYHFGKELNGLFPGTSKRVGNKSCSTVCGIDSIEIHQKTPHFKDFKEKRKELDETSSGEIRMVGRHQKLP